MTFWKVACSTPAPSQTSCIAHQQGTSSQTPGRLNWSINASWPAKLNWNTRNMCFAVFAKVCCTCNTDVAVTCDVCLLSTSIAASSTKFCVAHCTAKQLCKFGKQLNALSFQLSVLWTKDKAIEEWQSARSWQIPHCFFFDSMKCNSCCDTKFKRFSKLFFYGTFQGQIWNMSIRFCCDSLTAVIVPKQWQKPVTTFELIQRKHHSVTSLTMLLLLLRVSKWLHSLALHFNAQDNVASFNWSCTCITSWWNRIVLVIASTWTTTPTMLMIVKVMFLHECPLLTCCAGDLLVTCCVQNYFQFLWHQFLSWSVFVPLSILSRQSTLLFDLGLLTRMGPEFEMTISLCLDLLTVFLGLAKLFPQHWQFGSGGLLVRNLSLLQGQFALTGKSSSQQRRFTMHQGLLHVETINFKQQSGSFCQDKPFWFLQHSCSGSSTSGFLFWMHCNNCNCKLSLHWTHQLLVSGVSKHQRVFWWQSMDGACSLLLLCCVISTIDFLASFFGRWWCCLAGVKQSLPSVKITLVVHWQLDFLCKMLEEHFICHFANDRTTVPLNCVEWSALHGCVIWQFQQTKPFCCFTAAITIVPHVEQMKQIESMIHSHIVVLIVSFVIVMWVGGSLPKMKLHAEFKCDASTCNTMHVILISMLTGSLQSSSWHLLSLQIIFVKHSTSNITCGAWGFMAFKSLVLPLFNSHPHWRHLVHVLCHHPHCHRPLTSCHPTNKTSFGSKLEQPTCQVLMKCSAVNALSVVKRSLCKD